MQYYTTTIASKSQKFRSQKWKSLRFFSWFSPEIQKFLLLYWKYCIKICDYEIRKCHKTITLTVYVIIYFNIILTMTNTGTDQLYCQLRSNPLLKSLITCTDHPPQFYWKKLKGEFNVEDIMSKMNIFFFSSSHRGCQLASLNDT